jgi:RNA 2',3'-cyclic 3'-phosphodiesterase
MPRLFTAIELPEALALRLSMLRGGLASARWIDPENYHVTLRFAGDVDDVTAREFALALDAIEMPCFEMRLDGLGSFGGRKPRALWAGVAPNEPLAALQQAHERAARRAGLAPEPRNFHPHVTLARIRAAKPPAIAQWLERQGGFFAEPFTVQRFVLMSSRASTGGGPYIVEETYPLSDAEDSQGD